MYESFQNETGLGRNTSGTAPLGRNARPTRASVHQSSIHQGSRFHPIQRDDDATLGSVALRFGQGVLHGFTTFNVNRTPPDSIAEGIAQSFGTWVGITGTFVPYLGKAGRAIGLGSRAIARGGMRKASVGTATASSAPAIGAGISVPIHLGNMAVKHARQAANRLSTPAGREWAARNRLTLDAFEGAGRIGVAMGSLGWQEGLEGMLYGASFGVLFGGTDRMIGNITRQMREPLKQLVRRQPGMSDQHYLRNLAMAERTVGAISAGFVSGMPSTIMGMPWEYQIYDYLFGAWLGAEPPYHRRTAHAFIDQMRASNKHHLLMSKTMRQEMPEYKKLMKRHKNEKVRKGIIEELEAQVDFRFGKMHDAWSEAFYVIAAAEGRLTPEQMDFMRDSKFVRDVAEQARQSGLRRGMTDDQADNYAIDYAREQYARWKNGEQIRGEDLNIVDQAEPFVAGGLGYRLYQAVEVSGPGDAKTLGIVTSVSTKGSPLEVTAMDGSKLVVPDGRDKGRVVTEAELASQREALRYRYTQITEDQFQAMASAENADNPYPRELWEKFPRVRDAYLTNTVNEVQGGFRAVVKLGVQEIGQTGVHATSDAAKAAGEQFIMNYQHEGTLRVVNDLNDPSQILKQILNESDDFNSMVSVASVRQLTREIARAEGIDDAVATLQTYRKVLDIALSTQRERQPWRTFNERLSEMYPKFAAEVTKKPEIMNDMRNWYKRSMKERPVRKMAFRDGELVHLNEYYYDGRRAHEMKAPSYMSRVISNILGTSTDEVHVLHIDRVEKTELRGDSTIRSSETLHDAQITEADFYIMTHQLSSRQDLNDQQYYIMGGVKDKDTLRAIPLLFPSQDTALSFLHRRFNEMDATFVRDYRKSKQDFIKGMVKHAKTSQQEAASLFDRIFASEIQLFEKMNNSITGRDRFPVKFMSRNKGFLRTRAARNKRMQIMDAEGITADREFYQHIKGLERGSFNSLLINTVNDDGTSHALGLEEYRLKTMHGEDVLDSQMAKAHRDGVVIVRADVYDAMARDAGFGNDGDALKGVTAFGDRHGMFLGKYAMFRANDKANQFMTGNDTHLLYYTDSVKQQGNRKSYNMTVDKQGNTKVWSSKGLKVEHYNVPIDGVTFNMGKGDKPAKALAEQVLARQVLQQMLDPQFDSKIVKEELQDILGYAMQSRTETRQLLADIEEFSLLQLDPAVRDASLEKIRARIDKLDVDTIGINDINTILDGGEAYVTTGMYEKVVRHILDSPTQMDAWDRTMDINNFMELANNDYVASKDVILESLEGTLTPALTYSAGMRPLFEQAKASYFADRLVRPKVPYSMKSIGSGQDGWHLAEFGKLAVGTFMLGQGARNMKVRVFNQDMNLGQAWDQIQADRKRIADLTAMGKKISEKQGREKSMLLDKLKQWNHELTMVVARVPIEHASGVRPLRFIGFSNDRGTTSKLHPEDMSYLGGMDLDIDDVFIYQNMGKKKRTDSKGNETTLIDQLNRPEIKRRWHDEDGNFRDPLEHKEYWQVAEDNDPSFAKMFAPNENFSLARTTVAGNKALSIIANTKRDVQAFVAMFRANNANAEEYSLSQFQKFILKDASQGKRNAFRKMSEGIQKFRVKVNTSDEAIARIEELGRSGINMAADASNYLSFKEAGHITRDMLNEVIALEGFDGKKWRTVKWDLNSTPLFSKMKEASRHVDLRRQDGGRMRYSEMVLGLQKTEADFNVLSQASMGKRLSLNDIPGSFYSSAYMLSRAHANYEPFSEIVMTRLGEMYDIYNKIAGETQRGSLGTMIKLFSGGHPGRQSEALPYGERRRRTVTKENFVKEVAAYREAMKNPKLTIRERQAHIDRMYDFLANDLHAMNSAISLYREGARLMKAYDSKPMSNGLKLEMSMLNQIATQVSVFKWNMVNLQREKTAMTKSELDAARQQSYWREYKSMESLRDAIAQYRANLPKELRKFHDFFAMGAFTTQSATYRFMQNNPFYAHIPRQHSRDFYSNYLALTRMKSDKVKEDVFRQVIEGDPDFRHLIYNENSGISQKPPPIRHTLDQIKPATKERTEQLNREQETMSRASEEYATYLRNVEAANKARAESGLKFTSEQQQMVADLKKLFHMYPQLRHYFHSFFPGQLADATVMAGPRPEMATMEDVRRFIGIMQGYRHGNLLRDVVKIREEFMRDVPEAQQFRARTPEKDDSGTMDKDAIRKINEDFFKDIENLGLKGLEKVRSTKQKKLHDLENRINKMEDAGAREEDFGKMFELQSALRNELEVVSEYMSFKKAQQDSGRQDRPPVDSDTFHGGQGRLPRFLPKSMWWMMPNRYHEVIAPFDNALVHTYGPVLTAPGVVTKGPVSLLTSSPSRLNKMGTAMDQAIQWNVKEFSERFFEDHQVFEKSLGKDHDLMWDYVALMRESRNLETFSSHSRARLDKAEAKMRDEIPADRVFKFKDKELTLDQMVTELDSFITNKTREVWEMLIDGRDSHKYRKVKEEWVEMETGELVQILDTDAIFTLIQKNLYQGDPGNVDMIGVDLLQQVAYQYAMENRIIFKNPELKRGTHKFDDALRNAMTEFPYRNMTPLPFDAYYPHFLFDSKGQQAILAKRWRQMMEHGRSEEEASRFLAQEVFNGDPSDPAASRHMNETIDVLMEIAGRGVDDAAMNRLRSGEIPGSLKHRNRVDPITGEGGQIDGWQTDITAMLAYSDNLIGMNFRKMMALAGAKEINDFEGRLVRDDKAAVAANGRHPWADFFRLYVRDIVGTTTELPASWLEGYKELGIKRSGYKYFTDSYYRNLDLRISKKLGTKPVLAENNPNRPFRLVQLANMEAKFSLMTLLSRPKTAMTNLYGGSQLQQIDLGWKNFFRGHNLEALKQLDPEKQTWADWIRYAEQHGAMETLVRNEIMATPAYRDIRYRRGLEQMMLRLKRDPTASDETLWAIGKKYGLSNAVMDTAALPMRFSERILRSRTFLGHMLKAADVMEVAGPRPHEDPWVLEMARRGTVSAQFLYNASNRPAFARTNVGKIMSRFKMWAFNSVQFRNLARQQAAEMGYDPNSPAYDRFQRMITSDAILFGLAALFPFTLFDTAIPEPYGWLKDLVSWAFGDEQDRETAFFGALPGEIAPVNIVLPPSSRVITTWAGPLVTGEWDGFLGYHLWSFFPFGLLARDVKRAVEEPGKAPRRLTGVPLDELKPNLPTPFGNFGDSLDRGSITFE